MATNGQGFNWQQLLQYIGPALNMMAENSRNQRQANPTYAPSDSEAGLMNQMRMNEYANANENARRETTAASGQFNYDPNQKAQYDRAGQTMENYLKMANQFPTMQATPQVQQASNTMFGGNQQLTSPWQSKTQAEIGAYQQKAPIEREQQALTAAQEIETKFNTVNKLAEMLNIPVEQRGEFATRSMGMYDKTGQKTAYQQETGDNRTAALVGMITSKNMFDPNLGIMKVANNKAEALGLAQATALKYGMNPNDPAITNAIETTWASPVKQQPQAVGAWDPRRMSPNYAYMGSQTPAATANKAVTPTAAPAMSKKLQSYYSTSPKVKSFIDQARQRYSDQEIEEFISQQNGE